MSSSKTLGSDRPGLPVLEAGSPIAADTYHQVKSRLTELVEEFAAAGRMQLPPEDRLSATLGVSRPTVRSALLALQMEGKIQRLHGRGTFINRYALRMRANVAEDRPFIDLITRLGRQASVRTVSKRRLALPDGVAKALEVSPPATGIAIKRVFEADSVPAVVSIDYVAESLFGDRPARTDPSTLDPGTSTFDFLESNTGHQVHYSVAELIPAVPPSEISRHLGVGAHDPVLLLRHLHVSPEQVPIAVTDAYVHDGIIRFSVVRNYSGL